MENFIFTVPEGARLERYVQDEIVDKFKRAQELVAYNDDLIYVDSIALVEDHHQRRMLEVRISCRNPGFEIWENRWLSHEKHSRVLMLAAGSKTPLSEGKKCMIPLNNPLHSFKEHVRELVRINRAGAFTEAYVLGAVRKTIDAGILQKDSIRILEIFRSSLRDDQILKHDITILYQVVGRSGTNTFDFQVKTKLSDQKKFRIEYPAIPSLATFRTHSIDLLINTLFAMIQAKEEHRVAHYNTYQNYEASARQG